MIVDIDQTPDFPSIGELSTAQQDAAWMAQFISNLHVSCPRITLREIFECSELFPRIVAKYYGKGAEQ